MTTPAFDIHGMHAEVRAQVATLAALKSPKLKEARQSLEAIERLKEDVSATHETAEKALEIFGQAVGEDADDGVKHALLSQVESTRAWAVRDESAKGREAKSIADALKKSIDKAVKGSRKMPPRKLSARFQPQSQISSPIAAWKLQRPARPKRSTVSPRLITHTRSEQKKRTLPFPLPR